MTPVLDDYTCEQVAAVPVVDPAPLVARTEFGGNRLVYVNDARSNDHGALLLHVHVDLLPPAVAATPPSPAAGAAGETGGP